MTRTPLIVPDLTVHVVTGDTCYPHERGFSAIYAEISPTTPDLIEQLSWAQEHGSAVTLRCAMLEVTGRIAGPAADKAKGAFTLNIEDIVYRNPKKPNKAAHRTG